MVALGLTTAEQFEEVSAIARTEFASARQHCFMPVYIAYGQRQRDRRIGSSDPRSRPAAGAVADAVVASPPRNCTMDGALGQRWRWRAIHPKRISAMAEILIVDDSPTFRHTCGAQLQAAGYVVRTAEDGEQGLRLLRASPVPFVVLLDVVMPRLGGIGVLLDVDASPDLARRHAFLLVTATPEAVPPRGVSEMLKRLQIPILMKSIALPDLLSEIRQAARRLADRFP